MGNRYVRATPEELWEKFWSRVDWNEDEPDRCWLFLGLLNKKGYGRFFDGQKVVLAHRYVYQEMVGQPLPGMVVMHTCDTPSCVNWRHLTQGTIGDNQQDMAAKGRSKARHWGKGGVCVNGHPWDGNEYIYPNQRKRICRRCKADEQRRRLGRV